MRINIYQIDGDKDIKGGTTCPFTMIITHSKTQVVEMVEIAVQVVIE